MSTTNLRNAPLLPIACLLVSMACGKTGISAPGVGGTVGEGGLSSQGGTLGAGGTISAGGTLGAGGTISAGGTLGTGGTINSGGILGSGGSSGGSSGGAGGREPIVHRPQALSCVGVFAPPEPVNPRYGQCTKHADCTAGANGRCIHGIGSGSSNYYCVYDQCASDSDCDAGKVCHCTPSDAPRCLSVGKCRTDADCGSAGYCSPSNGSDCGGIHGIDSFYCHTPKDTCLDDRDCTGSDYCNYDAVDGRWECTAPNMNCVIG